MPLELELDGRHVTPRVHRVGGRRSESCSRFNALTKPSHPTNRSSAPRSVRSRPQIGSRSRFRSSRTVSARSSRGAWPSIAVTEEGAPPRRLGESPDVGP